MEDILKTRLLGYDTVSVGFIALFRTWKWRHQFALKLL